VPHRHRHHRRQEQHDDVGQIEHRVHQAGEQRRHAHVDARRDVARLEPAGVGLGRALGLGTHVGAADGGSAGLQLHARRVGGGADHVHLRALPRQ
jgi:hypothetical protein